ncbi:Hsp20/alpha crystallin family protein [Pseudoduganella flava]|nr:Hsp20/alpha crystallin family protein [Pseudoduganella flava]QGZ37920.1 Hsp20 family protein [Pseudoduganella flava]
MANHLMNFDPFSGLSSELSRFDPLRNVEELLRDFGGRGIHGTQPAMRLDVSESEQGYCVKAEIPGVKKEDIHVDVDGNRVTISAETRQEHDEKKEGKLVRSERYYGQQYRSFTLDKPVDEAQAQARYENGVVALTLPKKAGGNGRKVQIT